MAKKQSAPAQAENRALDRVLEEIRKKAGAEAIMRFDGDYHAEIPVIPTGSVSLDIKLC